MRVDPAIAELEWECHGIVTLICSESVSSAEIDRRIARLRDRASTVFPGRPEVFEQTYGQRFQRLRTRFRAAPGLF